MPNAHAKGRAASNGDYAAIKNGSPQLLIPCTALLTLLIVLLRPRKRKRFAFPSIKHSYMWRVLKVIGVPSHVLHAFKELHVRNVQRVRVRCYVAEGFLLPLYSNLYWVIAERCLI